MGIYIKGMEIPTSCMTCLFQTPYMGGWCFLLDGNSNAYSRRCDCPLVPISKHGRLIDADALEQDAQKRILICNKYDNQFQKPYEIMNAIALAPTIIEAEEKT